jgi:hypothetical protein
MAKPTVCEAPITRGPNRGQLATGTDAGYLRHRNAGEAACEWCREAHNLLNRTYLRAYYREHRPKYLAKQRRAKLRRYNLEVHEYEALLAAQGGVCAICGSKDPGSRVELFSVDHDHRCCPGQRSCGQCIRGLLCVHCNMGLGKFGDNRERLAAATDYLTRSS